MAASFPTSRGSSHPTISPTHAEAFRDAVWRYSHFLAEPEPEVILYAFDLIELDGEDLRREPLEVRKATIASVIARAASAVASENSVHLTHDHQRIRT